VTIINSCCLALCANLISGTVTGRKRRHRRTKRPRTAKKKKLSTERQSDFYDGDYSQDSASSDGECGVLSLTSLIHTSELSSTATSKPTATSTSKLTFTPTVTSTSIPTSKPTSTSKPMVTSTPTSTSTCGEEKEEEDYKITSVPPWLRPTSVPAPPVNNRKHCTPEAGKKQKKRLKVKPKKGREFIPTPPPPCTWEYLNSLKEIPAPDTRPSSGFVDLGSIFTVNWAKVFCRHNWQYALSCFVTETREELIKIVEDACFSKKKVIFYHVTTGGVT